MIKARREIVKIVFENLKLKDENLSNSLADNFSKYRVELICLFPNSIKTLTELKTKGIKLGLITNGTSEEQRAKIDRFKLAVFFDTILIEHEVGFGKPDLRIFNKALEQLKAEAKETWMIGDNLVWDVAAPQKLGIYSIWNDYQHKGLPVDSVVIPDKVINDIAEVLDMA
jgi:putative hydrolase of the HAD superfamily